MQGHGPLRSTAWGKGLGCAPPAGNVQGSKHPDKTDPSGTCHPEGWTPVPASTLSFPPLCPDGRVQSLLVPNPAQGSRSLVPP